MRNAQSLIMLFLAAAFAVNLYAAETPEIKYDEARAILLYNNGDCDNAFQLFQQAAAKGDAAAQKAIADLKNLQSAQGTGRPGR